MFSLRTRLFVTVAVVLAGATGAAGLLSRRATLVEERQILSRRQMPPLEGVASDVQHAYAAGGWDRTRSALHATGARIGARLLALDTANRPVAASVPVLESVTIKAADAGGNLSPSGTRRGTTSAGCMSSRPMRTRPT